MPLKYFARIITYQLMDPVSPTILPRAPKSITFFIIDNLLLDHEAGDLV